MEQHNRNKKKVSKRGGKRPGAGRKAGVPTKTKTFRIDADALSKAEKLYGRALNKKVNEWFKRLVRNK